MNPSDDEEINESTARRSEEIDGLLEPKAIPDERIVRHAERNDSYREAPTLTNDEEIIQPPLEPTLDELEEKIKQASPLEYTIESKEEESEDAEVQQSPQESFPDEIITKQEQALLASLPTISQQDVLPAQEIDTTVPPTQPIKIDSEVPESSTVYHTVSGGPETIHDLMAGKIQTEQVAGPHAEVIHPSGSSASGYSIPNPNYVTPLQTVHEDQSNFGFMIPLVISATIAAALSYLYFFMPQTFDQMYDAILIIKDQIFKQS